MIRSWHSSAFIALCGLCVSCQSPEKEQQLQNVAKDWSMVIRASQVVPVYPLTEDLQPGDVFMVETPVQTQVQTYRKRGFLPLDRHVTRLHDLEYADFYKTAFFD